MFDPILNFYLLVKSTFSLYFRLFLYIFLCFPYISPYFLHISSIFPLSFPYIFLIISLISAISSARPEDIPALDDAAYESVLSTDWHPFYDARGVPWTICSRVLLFFFSGLFSGDFSMGFLHGISPWDSMICWFWWFWWGHCGGFAMFYGCFSFFFLGWVVGLSFPRAEPCDFSRGDVGNASQLNVIHPLQQLGSYLDRVAESVQWWSWLGRRR